MTREELIAKLKAATEGSRELSTEIFWLVNPRAAKIAYWSCAFGKPCEITDLPVGGLGRLSVEVSAPHYTTSIDAALSLVLEGLDLDLKRARHRLGWRVHLWKIGGAREDANAATPVSADAPTAPLALCIAALKAR